MRKSETGDARFWIERAVEDFKLRLRSDQIMILEVYCIV